MKGKRVAIYLRVSTDGQTTENQELELRRVAEQRGWEIVGRYEDHGISGAKGRDQRPAFDKLCKDATRGRFDIIAAWSVDRVSRSVQHLITFMQHTQESAVGLYLHQQAVDTTTAAGKAMLQMMGVFAELERSVIRDRIMAGIARARASGKHIGRRLSDPSIDEKVLAMLGEGIGKAKTAKTLGIGCSVVQRIAREAATPAATVS